MSESENIFKPFIYNIWNTAKQDNEILQDTIITLIGRRYNREKKDVGRPENNVAKITTLRTESKLANEYGVAPRTIRNYAQKAKDFEELSKTKPELAQSIKNYSSPGG